LEGSVMNEQEIAERLLDFGARIGVLVDNLPQTRLGNHVAGQLVRSGTSPIPNYEEGCGAESRKDFIHKLRLCLKELRESRGWLRLIERTKMHSPEKMKLIIDEAEQLCNIFGKSVFTARQNETRKKLNPNDETK
jgi:four helix bundle protein